MNCLNCNTEINSNFCPNCGQKSSTSRITFKSFSRSLTNDLIDTDKGILFNLKNLTLRPGKSITDYIDGKRKNIFNPISYALLAITVYLIVSRYIGLGTTVNEKEIEGGIYYEGLHNVSRRAGEFLAKYVKFFFLLHIVYLSLFERLFFTKRNLYELMTMNAFIVGHSIIIGILFYPLFKYPLVFDPIVYLYMLVLSFLVFKRNYSKTESIAIPFFSLLMSFILMVLVPMLIIYILNLLK